MGSPYREAGQNHCLESSRILGRKPLSFLGLLSSEMLTQDLTSTLPTAPQPMAANWKFQNGGPFSRSGLEGENHVC